MKSSIYHYNCRNSNPLDLYINMYIMFIFILILQLDFDHCFTEHKSTKTFSQLYKVVGIIYKYTKLAIYHIFVILIGVPMAIVWAIINGITVFVIVWLWGPAIKLTVLLVYAVAPAFTAPLQAILAPLADIIARIFRQIRIRAHIDGSSMKKFGEHIV